MDDLALEEFRPKSEDAVRVWLAFDQPPEELVFTHQVVGFYKVDPQDALSNRGVSISLNLKRNIWHNRLRHVQVNRQGVQRYLGNGEAELGQLGLSDQRDGDAVGQNQVGADDVLNDAVTQTTAGEEQEKTEWDQLKGLFEVKGLVSW